MKVLLSGGGTGGHVYPAIAIANKIKEENPDCEILFVGTEKGIESEIVPKYGYELKTVKAAIEVNEAQKLKLVRKASNLVDNFEGMEVCVLGLTFKPGTDDLREAPSISNINYLLERGANITAYDPVGIENTKKIFGDSIKYTTSIDEAITNTELCFIMTEWKDIIEYDIRNYKDKMKNPVVLDGRNCYNVSDMHDQGIDYYSIGR